MCNYNLGYQHGWDAAVRMAAEIAENRHHHWNSHIDHRVACDVSACEDIATAIRDLEQ